MKTNKEMTDSVLNRATVVVEKRKMIRNWTAGAFCLVLILGLAAAPWSIKQSATDQDSLIAVPPASSADPTQPKSTEPTQESVTAYTGQLYFLNESQQTGMLTPMQIDMTYVTDNFIRIRHLKGLTDEERKQAIQEESQYMWEFRASYSGNGDGLSLRSSIEYDMIYQRLTGGHPSLLLPNCEEILSDERKTNGVFRVDGTRAWYKDDDTFTVGDTTVTIPKGSYRVYLHVTLSNETLKFLATNPDTPFSSLEDTITITVKYKDGTKAEILVDITMNDEGQIFLSMRGDRAA